MPRPANEPENEPLPPPEAPAESEWLPVTDPALALDLPTWLDMELPEFPPLEGPAPPSAPLPEPTLAELNPPPPEPPPLLETPLPEPPPLPDIGLSRPLPAPAQTPAPGNSPLQLKELPPTVQLDSPLPANGEVKPRRSDRRQKAGGPRSFVYGIAARNTGTRPVFHARVEHDLPAGMRYLGATPAPEVNGRRLTWHLGDLGPGEFRHLKVRVQPDPRASERPAERATFRASCTLQTVLARPRLALKLLGPEMVECGKEAALEVVVGNPGTAPAKDVRLESRFPRGLRHPTADDPPEENLGTLAPGEVRRVTLTATASRPGLQTVEVFVRGAPGLEASARTEVEVTEAALRLGLLGPVRCILGREITCRLDLFNPGSAAARQVQVLYAVPEGFDLVRATDEGTFDPASRCLVWTLDRIFPGDTHTLKVHLLPKLPGEVLHRAEARAAQGMEAHAESVVSIAFDEEGGGQLLEKLLTSADGKGLGVAGLAAALLPENLQRRAAQKAAAQHVVFTLAGTEYAVPIDNVLEVGRPLTPTPVPNVPEWVLGVANVRGDIVSMIDLRAFLGLPPHPGAERRLLVVRARSEELAVGLVVDRVGGIRDIPPAGVNTAATVAEGAVTAYVRGVAEADGERLVVLDLERLLLTPELRAFELV
jgi:chemotaxis signal transduction protein